MKPAEVRHPLAADEPKTVWEVRFSAFGICRERRYRFRKLDLAPVLSLRVTNSMRHPLI